jgi:ipoprotein LpqH
VDKRLIACVAAVLIVGGAAGCSSKAEPVAKPPGSLLAGTAEVSVNGTDVNTTNAVSCTTTGAVTNIKTGDDQAGTTSAVKSADGLAVPFAQITNLGGFTGSYWQNLGPAAKVKMTGGTYEITGTATGFNADNPSARATETFTIKVAC